MPALLTRMSIGPISALDVLDRVVDAVLAGDVEGDAADANAGLGELVGGLAQGLGVARVEDDVGPGAGERRRLWQGRCRGSSR